METMYKPDAKENKIQWIPMLALILVAPSMSIARHSVLLAILVIAAALAAAAYLASRVPGVRIVLDDDSLQVHGIYRTSRIERSEIRTAALIPRLIGAGRQGEAQLLLLDSAGRRLARLFAPFWPWAALQDIAAHLGVQTWVADGPVSNSDLAKQFPNAIGFADRRPFVFAILTLAGMLAIVLMLALIFAFVMTRLDSLSSVS